MLICSLADCVMQDMRRLADLLATLVQAGDLQQQVEDLQADRLGQEVTIIMLTSWSYLYSMYCRHNCV